MSTQDILKQITNLPLRERLVIIKKTVESIREVELAEQLSVAAEEMQQIYKRNQDLTSFISIDMDAFYEPR